MGLCGPGGRRQDCTFGRQGHLPGGCASWVRVALSRTGDLRSSELRGEDPSRSLRPRRVLTARLQVLQTLILGPPPTRPPPWMLTESAPDRYQDRSSGAGPRLCSVLRSSGGGKLLDLGPPAPKDAAARSRALRFLHVFSIQSHGSLLSVSSTLRLARLWGKGAFS